MYPVGQNLLAAWNQDWEVGSALVAKAQTAMANQDWRTVSAQVLALGDLTHPHWQEEQVHTIARQIYAEQQAQAQIRQAVTLASLGSPERLITASRLVSLLSTETLARQSAQTYLDRWGNLLLAEGIQRWYRNDLDGAIQLGHAVLSNPNRAKAAQELIWLGLARRMARESLGSWTVTPSQMASLYTAMLLANRIPSDSPYYPQAQSSVATWRTHLDGMGTLQLAQLPGGIPQVNTLKIALRQAGAGPNPDGPLAAIPGAVGGCPLPAPGPPSGPGQHPRWTAAQRPSHRCQSCPPPRGPGLDLYNVPLPTELAPMPPPPLITSPRISPPLAPVFTAPPPGVVPPPSLNPPMALPPTPIRTPHPIHPLPTPARPLPPAMDSIRPRA